MQAIKKSYLISNMGFSLVELLMALAASSIILVAICSVFSITNKNFTTQNVAASTQQDLRSAIGLMARDIRLAGLDPAGSDNFGILYASRTKNRFTLDSIDSGSSDFNGIVDETNFEQITYELQGDQIIQTLYEGTASQNSASLISNIVVMQFSYFDAANNDLIDAGLTPPRVPTDQLDDIRSVEILITVQEPAGRDEPVRRTLTRRVECRNMAYN